MQRRRLAVMHRINGNNDGIAGLAATVTAASHPSRDEAIRLMRGGLSRHWLASFCLETLVFCDGAGGVSMGRAQDMAAGCALGQQEKAFGRVETCADVILESRSV